MDKETIAVSDSSRILLIFMRIFLNFFWFVLGYSWCALILISEKPT